MCRLVPPSGTSSHGVLEDGDGFMSHCKLMDEAVGEAVGKVMGKVMGEVVGKVMGEVVGEVMGEVVWHGRMARSCGTVAWRGREAA